MTQQDLTHIDDRGRASMVDVGDKATVRRTAVAEGFLVAKPGSLDRLMRGDLPKGEALAVARVAGIQAAKRCAETIPLCHTLPLDSVNIEFERAEPGRLRVLATVRTTARTGVEMEALLATSTAILTVWDMLKAIDPDLIVESITLREKTKGPAS